MEHRNDLPERWDSAVQRQAKYYSAKPGTAISGTDLWSSSEEVASRCRPRTSS
jgi:hypothetical protein